MSVKRQATTELNHENWDQEDPSEHEEMGKFKAAPKDILEKRVIRTARRRNLAPASEEQQKSIFSGFGGFNKTQPSSFDFLKNLTNGGSTNGSTTGKPDITESTHSSVFSKKTTSELPSSGMFSSPPTSTATTFGSQQKSPHMSQSTSNTGMGSVFQTANNDNNTPFKIQNSNVTEPKSTNVSPRPINVVASQPSCVFGSLTTSSSKAFTNSAAPFKSQNFTSNEQQSKNKTNTESPEASKEESELSEHKLKYYTKLKELNRSVSDWIKTHVEATPLCILSPVFKDYERHLKCIQDEFHEIDNKVTTKPLENKISESKEGSSISTKESPFSVNNKPSTFSSNIPTTKTEENKEEKPGFTFGIKPATTNSAGFSFGINTTSANTSSPFSLSTNTTTDSSTPAPFSFGIGKPFSFNSTVQNPAEPTNKEANNEDEDEPPKVEYNKIEEDNSVFDKKCKVFVKKDANFADKGVGTLYIKKIEESGKHQLLVRANTSLGNILLNFILSSGIPIQRMGKNNVMLVCIPTPESKPPPTPILVRVKTAEEADELLETLNKYKA